LLLESFAEKKKNVSVAFQLTLPDSYTFSPLETLPFLAHDGITDFVIALAKDAISLSAFVRQIDRSKTFSDGTRNNMWCRCNARILAIGRKMRFHNTLSFMTK